MITSQPSNANLLTSALLVGVLLSSSVEYSTAFAMAKASFIRDVGKYLVYDSQTSSSGKSTINEAQEIDSCTGQPTGEPLIIKISSNQEALERETRNYERISQTADQIVAQDGIDPHDEGLFVKVYDHMPEISPNSGEGAIVMEKGCQDLRQYIQEKGPLEGEELRSAAESVAKCVQAVHESDMVWTEIKAQNFVVKKDYQDSVIAIKGIDLESAVPNKGNPIDYTPEACPPEFAEAYLCGKEPYVQMMPHFDVWSLGMLFYELATGKEYFGVGDGDDKNQFVIASELRTMADIEWKHPHVDPRMKDLVQTCLNKQPEERPTVSQVLQHEFFLQP